MSTTKRALLGVVASAPLLLAIASAPAFGQADASNRPFRPVTADMLSHPPASDWLQYRRTYDGQGFSPLAKVTKANVGKLVPIWEFSTGLTKGHEVVPIEHDGVLVVTDQRLLFVGLRHTLRVPYDAIRDVAVRTRHWRSFAATWSTGAASSTVTTSTSAPSTRTSSR